MIVGWFEAWDPQRRREYHFSRRDHSNRDSLHLQGNGKKRSPTEVQKAKLTQKPALTGFPLRSCSKKPQNQPFSSSLCFTSAPLLLMIVMT